tara:strand:+ start:614 stop:1237 length:624 start_codon:yes stop_codon:yes gene_type:complete
MKHYVYKLTDKTTNEFYYGVRTCECEIKDDSYMGSMVGWKANKDNLLKEIVCEFGSREESVEFERKIIEDNIKHHLNRNYHTGMGMAFYGKNHTEETKVKQSESMKGKHLGEKNPFYGKKHSPETLRIMMEANLGKTHSDDTKQKMSETATNIDRSEYKLNRTKIQYIPTGEVFISMYEASKKLGTSRNRIRRHINNTVPNVQFKRI